MVRGSVLACAALLTVEQTGSADENLRRAHEEFENVELERAERSLAASLESGKNSSGDLIELYMLRGQIAAALGNADEAVDRFRCALSLDPGLELVGVAPKLAVPFARAKLLTRRGRPLDVRSQLRGSPHRAVVLTIASDPMDMVAKVVMTDLVSGQTIRVTATRELVLPVPDTARHEMVISVRDRYGNELKSIGTSAVPMVVGAISVPISTRVSEGTDTELTRDVGGRPGGGWRAVFWSGVLLTGAAVAGWTYSGLVVVSEEKDIERAASKYDGPDLPGIDSNGTPNTEDDFYPNTCGSFASPAAAAAAEHDEYRAQIDLVRSGCARGDQHHKLINWVWIPGTATAAVFAAVAYYKGYVAPRKAERRERDMARSQRRPSRLRVIPALGPDLVGAGLDLRF